MDDNATPTSPEAGPDNPELWDIDQVTKFLGAEMVGTTRYTLARLGVKAAVYRRPGGTGQPRAFYDADQIRKAIQSQAEKARSKTSEEGLDACASPDCTRDALPSDEWCSGHRGRLARHGDLKLGVPFQRHGNRSVPTGCVTAGCTEQAIDGELYCVAHDVAPEKDTTCEIQGCERTVLNTGLCGRCYQSWWKRGHNRSRYRSREGRCGGRCAVCRWDYAREMREDLRGALEQGPLHEEARREIVRRVWDGEPLEEVVVLTGLSVGQLWSIGEVWPEFLYALDAGLMARRDPSISHASPSSYRVHRCPCPQCREAKARNRH